jgi:hypothetical protein
VTTCHGGLGLLERAAVTPAMRVIQIDSGQKMKTTATLLDEVVINVFSGRLRRDLHHGIARIGEGLA